MFPDGVKFYPDIQDGIRGFNTDPARGADTFSPFKSEKTYTLELYVTNYGSSIQASAYIKLGGTTIGRVSDQVTNNASHNIAKSASVKI